jgi:YfiH family protein
MRIGFGTDFDDRIGALMSARAGGISQAPYEHCNLGDHVRDDPGAVERNRAAFAQALQAVPMWLTQVHGRRIVRLSRDHGHVQRSPLGETPSLVDTLSSFNPETDAEQARADGALTTERGLACTVMVADCLPVLLAAPEGKGVAALHAGWRGLAGAGDMNGQGIVHAGVLALCEATGVDPSDLRGWLGPCIGPKRFEVGSDVLTGFGVDPANAKGHPRFRPHRHFMGDGTESRLDADRMCHPALPGKWLADLAGLARDTLASVGVHRVDGGHWCTVSDASRFFSFRRDGVTGRQAAAIFIR